MQREIKARCAALERLFQLCATQAEAEQIEKQSSLLRRYAVTGEGHMHVLLERISKRNRCSIAELRELTTVTLMLDRLVVLGAGFAILGDLQAVDPARLQRIREAIVAVGEGHPQKVKDLLGDLQTPLPGDLDRIERTLRHIGDSTESSATERTAGGLQAPLSSRSWKDSFTHLLVPDAFTNYDYFIYALKLSVCASI